MNEIANMIAMGTIRQSFEHGGVTYHLIDDFGPEEARALLDAVPEYQRRLRMDYVSRYAGDMKNGNWRAIPNVLMVDTQGHLINGQHRCRAILRSGNPVPVILAEVSDADAYDAIDLGAARTRTDVIKAWRGKGRLPDALATAHNQVIAAGVFKALGFSRSKQQAVSHAEALRMALEEPRLEMLTQIPNHTRASSAFLGGALACIQADPEALHFFTDVLSSSPRVGMSQPAMKLREWLIEAKSWQRGKSRSSEEFAYRAIVGWNAFVLGKPTKQLRYKSNYTIPTPLVTEKATAEAAE